MTHPNEIFSQTSYPQPSMQPAVDDALNGVETAVRNPNEASGWPAVLVPAIATGLVLAYLSRKGGM